jgi:hypothetical protein
MLAAALGFLFAGGLAGAASQPPAVGGMLPEIILTAPNNAVHQEYLGIAGGKTFTIPEIKADIVIIEIFSMY